MATEQLQSDKKALVHLASAFALVALTVLAFGQDIVFAQSPRAAANAQQIQKLPLAKAEEACENLTADDKAAERVAYCSRVIQLDAKSPVGYTFRGIAYNHLGQYDKAIEDFTLGIKLLSALGSDQNTIAYYNRSVSFLQKKEYDKAVADITKCIEFEADNAGHYVGRGFIYEEMGKKNLAIQDYRKALKLDPKDKEAKESLKRLGG
jgi:tetratricopeptide (TPR) repeat protein